MRREIVRRVLRDDALDRMPEVLLEAFVPWDFHSVRVQAQLPQNRRVNIGDVMRIFDGVKPDLVSCSVSDSPLQPTTGHPHTESVRMMVSAV